jgi:hypothetical protein
MTARLIRYSSALAVAAAFSASAYAEYRCDAPPSWVDRSACSAADQGPDALRRFVQNMNTIRINIQFVDYVNEQKADAWDVQRRQRSVQAPATEGSQKVAANTR